jgi:probable 2-oxoglutarate dehydrogenase E1 component DHKTD1
LVSLNTIFAGAAEQGISDVVLAMPHRGRFNVLVELLDYPADELFRKISGKNDLPADFYTAIDDVTSHVAASARRAYSSNTDFDRGKQLI